MVTEGASMKYIVGHLTILLICIHWASSTERFCDINLNFHLTVPLDWQCQTYRICSGRFPQRMKYWHQVAAEQWRGSCIAKTLSQTRPSSVYILIVSLENCQ